MLTNEFSSQIYDLYVKAGSKDLIPIYEQVPNRIMKNNNEFTSLNLARLDKNLIIGNGRLASHLAYYFSLLKIPFTQVYRKKHSSKEIKKLIHENDRIFLAIYDREIANFVNENFHHGKVWIHFSGSLNVENVFSCHPLTSFSERLYDLKVYEKIHFVLSGWGQSAPITLNQLIPFLKNPSSYLDPQHKSLYHSLCVIAGNFPIILWSEVLKEFEKLHIPAQGLELYLQNNLDNFKSLHENALTGPLQRKDMETIQKNLKALEDREVLQELYKNFLKIKGMNV